MKVKAMRLARPSLFLPFFLFNPLFPVPDERRGAKLTVDGV